MLVIEDEEGMAEVLGIHLEAAGMAVEKVSDGVSALARLDGPAPDVVLLDLGLPRVSGYRVMNVLRHTRGWEEIPVVVVTAYNFEEAGEVIRAGIDEFLAKPFELEDLVARVANVINRRRKTS